MKEWTAIRAYVLAGPQTVELDGDVHDRSDALAAIDRMQAVCVAAIRAAEAWALYQGIPEREEKAWQRAFDRACELAIAVDEAAKALHAYGLAPGESDRAYAGYFKRELARFKGWLVERDARREAEAVAARTPLAEGGRVWDGQPFERQPGARDDVDVSAFRPLHTGRSFIRNFTTRDQDREYPLPPPDELWRVSRDNDLLRAENLELRERLSRRAEEAAE